MTPNLLPFDHSPTPWVMPTHPTEVQWPELITVFYFDAFSLFSFQQQQQILIYFSSQNTTLSQSPLSSLPFSQTSSHWNVPWLSLWCLFSQFLLFPVSLMTSSLYLLYNNDSQVCISTSVSYTHLTLPTTT